MKWTGLPPKETSWENVKDLQALRPSLNLEDKVKLHVEGIDTNEVLHFKVN